jgi:sterol desaturase/sphingolipid hydroxylase (fatty acid hydroxylase superfamily)
MQALIQTIGESSYLLMSYLTHISSRLCIVYFIPMLIVTYFIALKQGVGWSAQLQSIKSTFRSRWLGRSALQDYGLIVLNVSLKIIFFSHLVVLGLDFSVWISERLTDYAGVMDLGVPLVVIMVVYTTVFTLVDDVSVYLVHRWMHTSPLLWSFHSVHHSATQLTPLTWLRIHPVEGVINTMRRAHLRFDHWLIYVFIWGDRL